ncbi:AzlD domain-containing protein [Celerinatantimonas sp. MCCC 1A17872]|uniref:AzlD domain-containing protein n=1 Tax=Celerinatantimonas sp. MCCC 1A17872 TaxID=3177514 RepID=UPI0038C5B667
MSTSIWWIILGGCLGTFLIRYLPLRRATKSTGSSRDNALRRFLIALGPSAITVLLVASLWPMVHLSHAFGDSAKIVGALIVICLVKYRWGGIALPTFCGVGAFAVLAYWLG